MPQMPASLTGTGCRAGKLGWRELGRASGTCEGHARDAWAGLNPAEDGSPHRHKGMGTGPPQNA